MGSLPYLSTQADISSFDTTFFMRVFHLATFLGMFSVPYNSAPWRAARTNYPSTWLHTFRLCKQENLNRAGFWGNKKELKMSNNTSISPREVKH